MYIINYRSNTRWFKIKINRNKLKFIGTIEI